MRHQYLASNADLDLFVQCGDVGKVESTVLLGR